MKRARHGIRHLLRYSRRHRRDRLPKALLDYGRRVQESMFVAHLDDELRGRMLARVDKLVEKSEDRLHVFALCNACESKALSLGTGELPEDPLFVIV